MMFLLNGKGGIMTSEELAKYRKERGICEQRLLQGIVESDVDSSRRLQKPSHKAQQLTGHVVIGVNHRRCLQLSLEL